MSTKHAWMIVCATLLLLAAAIPISAIVAAHFETENADETADWRWLRQDDATATWSFEMPAGTTVEEPTACEIRMTGLVAPHKDAPVGHEKHLALTVASGDYSYRFRVFLDDEAGSTTSTALLSQGTLRRGSDRVALKRLCRTYLETGSLDVDYTWRPSIEVCCHNNPKVPHHVAVSAQSVQVLFPM